MANTIDNEPFINILFTKKINNETKNETVKTLLLPYITDKNKRFPSELLTKYVYQHPDSVVSEGDSVWNTNIATLRTASLELDVYEKELREAELIKLLSKMERNIEIAKVQYDLMSKETEKLATSAKDSQKQFKDLNDKTTALYSNFVSTLGIFVAISFSLFGAATLINNLFQINSIFSKSENMKEAADVLPKLVGTNIMLGGILTLLIYLLIIGLMSGISRIINKKYDFNIFLLLVVLIISSAIITFGFAYSHKTFIENPWDDFNLISGHFMIISILFSLLLIIAYIGYRINNYFSKREDPK